MDDFLESIAANCQGKMLIIGTKEIPKKQNTEVDTELSIKPLDLDICRKHLANNQIEKVCGLLRNGSKTVSNYTALLLIIEVVRKIDQLALQKGDRIEGKFEVKGEYQAYAESSVHSLGIDKKAKEIKGILSLLFEAISCVNPSLGIKASEFKEIDVEYLISVAETLSLLLDSIFSRGGKSDLLISTLGTLGLVLDLLTPQIAKDISILESIEPIHITVDSIQKRLRGESEIAEVIEALANFDSKQLTGKKPIEIHNFTL